MSHNKCLRAQDDMCNCRCHPQPVAVLILRIPMPTRTGCWGNSQRDDIRSPYPPDHACACPAGCSKAQQGPVSNQAPEAKVLQQGSSSSRPARHTARQRLQLLPEVPHHSAPELHPDRPHTAAAAGQPQPSPAARRPHPASPGLLPRSHPAALPSARHARQPGAAQQAQQVWPHSSRGPSKGQEAKLHRVPWLLR